MTDDVTDRARAALEGVTDGPWEAPETILGQRCTTVFGKDRKQVLYHAGTDANARFTAAARSLVPELLAEVKRERSRSRDLHYAIDQLRKDAPPCDGGCNPNDGPQEECSAHGRTPADLWRQLDIVRKQRDDAVAEVEKLRTALCDVAIDQYLREKGMTL